MMVLQHFGLTHYPVSKAPTELRDDGALELLGECFTGCWRVLVWACSPARLA